MTSRKPTTTASIRALDELRDVITEKANKKYGFERSYKGGDYSDHSNESRSLDTAKNEILDKISKEIEAYAVEKYAKFGVMVVPVCHRSSRDGDDRLNVQLKVKVYPGIERFEKKYIDNKKARLDDLKRVDDWYFKALQAIAARESIPALPKI